MRTFRDAKAMAKSLRAELLARKQVELSHSECLEIVSRQFGVDNWNILSAKVNADAAPGPWGAVNTTIPILRIFSVERAKQFYVDFLGCTLDFGGPARGPGTPSFYAQVSRAQTTLHLTESPYDPGPGSTVSFWLDGIEALHTELNDRRETMRVWGPAIWVPFPEPTPWDALTMTISDPFGNHLRFNEPTDPAARATLPRWVP